MPDPRSPRTAPHLSDQCLWQEERCDQRTTAAMTQQPIRFDDGAAYDRGMGVWSQLAEQVFLDWLAPSSGLRWIDIGCGSGAFTELLAQRCAPAEIQGIDPSEAQFAFARAGPALRGATFLRGDAMALPFETDRFDAAVMALVLFFVPDPAKGVAEMARVVRPGGTVSSYLWIAGEGPPAPFAVELAAFGATVARARARTPRVWKCCARCGRMRAWRRWRAAKLRCAEPSPTSMTYGPRAWAYLRSRTPSPRWRPATSNSSRRDCGRACQLIPRDGSRMRRASTRSRVACQTRRDGEVMG